MASTDSANDSKQLHVAMFPWLAFGHIIPFLHLSKFIAEKGHKVSFLSTTRNIQRLPTLPSNLSPLINFVKLALPRVQELPENAEATMDVPTQDVHYLKKAYDGLKPQVAQFLGKESPDWIIYDFAPYWLPEVAAGLGISRAYFSIINAWFGVFFGPSKDTMNVSDERKTLEDFLTPPKWIPFPHLTYAHPVPSMQATLDARAIGRPTDSGFRDAYPFGDAYLKGHPHAMFIQHIAMPI
ncbi:UDP-glucuronosyl/UDP-glucosyltransferase [Artemisia annua]|uniref:UDP-glucuronosyl/UDP-glucosyltransferase n=1 Tax=Artemisia annua TaxID=35608 RepID=A0A2U1KX56_ARTAN|nr:UDP-glucuronosyl/UDP-glucosyltransferase [Artemisia annua]